MPPSAGWEVSPHTHSPTTSAPDHGPGRGRAHPASRAGGSWPALRRPDADLYAPDSETKGGSEATVRIAQADLVPTEARSPARELMGCQCRHASPLATPAGLR